MMTPTKVTASTAPVPRKRSEKAIPKATSGQPRTKYASSE